MPVDPDSDAVNGDEGVVMDESSETADEVADESSDEVAKAALVRRASSASHQHRGPSTLWDDDQEWILIFDRLLNSPSRRGRESADRRRERVVPDEARDEEDGAATETFLARTASMTAARRPLGQKTSNGAVPSTGARVRRTSSLVLRHPSAASAASGTAAGAIDEATFIALFEQVPRVQIFSPKDLDDTLTKLREAISKQNNDWDVRVEALKKLRGVLMAGGKDFDDLYRHLRLMEPALQLTVQDLRSQVVREGCITVAYVSQQLGHRADHVCLSILPSLIELIPNSAKVISTSGVVAIRFIIQNTHCAKLVPVITGQMSSKSRDIRRACCEFLEHVITSWPAHVLEKHVPVVQEAIRRGVTDADAEVRATSRRAYWGFANHFREQAGSLLNSLDSQHKKMLAGEVSRPGGKNFLSAVGPRQTLPRSRSSSGSCDSLAGQGRVASFSRRSAPSAARQSPRRDTGKSPTPPAFRSTSAIDTQAAQRASARAQYAAAQRAGGSVGPASRLRQPAQFGTLSHANTGRHRSRSATQSQPGSRSGSPSSRLGPAAHSAAGGGGFQAAAHGTPGQTQTLGRRRRTSGIPRSTTLSREPSPRRQPADRTSASTPSASPRLSGVGLGWPITTHRVRQQNLDAENTPADSLYSGGRHSGPQSLGSLSSGEHDTLSRDVGDVVNQIASTQWSERREGLLTLQAILRSSRTLTNSELRRVTELFTKLFMDTHTKVFGVFLESVQELVLHHHADLADWLRLLLTRLLTKLGADLLTSVAQKLERTLDVVRASFPSVQQLHCLCRLLLDHNQTPNAKVKAATMRYMYALLDDMEPADLVNSSPELSQAITKVINWTNDQKAETKNAAKAVVVALFDLNTAEFTRILAQLPKTYQDTATDIMQQHLGRRVAGHRSEAEHGAGGSHTSPRPDCRPAARLDAGGRPTQEEVISSVRRTSPGLRGCSAEPPDSPTRRERDSTSQDSGISQVSTAAAGAAGPPPPPPADEEQTMASVLAELHLEAPDDRRDALRAVSTLARTGSERLWGEHFSTVLHLLLESLRDSAGTSRRHVLGALTEMLRRDCVAVQFLPFSELVFHSVLGTHQEAPEREVARAADQCAGALAARLPPGDAISVLSSLAQTEQFPVNKAAINTLASLIEPQKADLVEGWLPELMPILLKAYSNSESSVRKAAVFAIVAIHSVCGEHALESHLGSLSHTKMKLLRMYITRSPGSEPAQHSSTTPPQ